MFGISFLLSVAFTILRSLRYTLVVADLGGGAHLIPLFELCGGLPTAAGITWLMARLMNRYRMSQVFMITLAGFIGFFALFGAWIYPFVAQAYRDGSLQQVVAGGLMMLFYAMAECWKPALATVLFWGLTNRYLPLAEAKRLYAPVLVAGSLAHVVAGPIISLSTSEWLLPSTERWASALYLLLTAVAILGGIAALFYHRLQNLLSRQYPAAEAERRPAAFAESSRTTWKSPQLRLLSWMVIADYIAYGLGEVIYLDALKLRYPDPADYCHFMGHLSVCVGIVTAFSGLVITPWLLRRTRWVVAALAMPACLLVTEALFFFFLRGHSFSRGWFGWSESQWLAIAIFCGSLQYCLCRGAQYTLFDSSKEIALINLSQHERTCGKLIVDGVCSRLGRGIGSGLSLILVRISGTVLGSALSAGILAIGITFTWIQSVVRLGRFMDVEKRPAVPEAPAN
jgi:ATP:ADP antiporter, AAA family